MGTTLVAAVSYTDGTVISNVGDSRAYHITEGGIVRVTKDHSRWRAWWTGATSPRRRPAAIPTAI